MSVNWPVLLLWVQILTAVAALIFGAAWFLTGRKHTALRILATVFILTTSLVGILTTSLVGLYKALSGGPIF